MIRRILLILCLTSFVSAQSIRNHGLNGSCAASTCSSTSFTAINGDSILVFEGTSSAVTLNAPTDSGSNTYTAVTGPTTNGGSKWEIWKSDNITGFSSGTVIGHNSDSNMVIVWLDLSGTSGYETAAADKVYTATASPWASNTLTTANSHDLIVTCINNDTVAHTYTAPSGFSISDANTGFGCATKVVTSTQSNSYSWTGTGAADNMGVSALAFKQAVPTLGSPFVITP